MKPVFILFGVLVLIGLTTGCGSASQYADEAIVIGSGLADNLDEAAVFGAGLADNLDEAAVVGAGLADNLDDAAVVGAGLADNLDDAAVVGAGLADNLDDAAAVGANLGNDAARVSPAVIDDLVRTTTYQRIADLTGVTPDQQAVIENAIISTACEMLLTSLEGGELTREELIFRIGTKISGIFIDEAEEIDWILESADFLGGTLLNSGYDQGSLADYCGYLP